jgi:hypothetical protein
VERVVERGSILPRWWLCSEGLRWLYGMLLQCPSADFPFQQSREKRSYPFGRWCASMSGAPPSQTRRARPASTGGLQFNPVITTFVLGTLILGVVYAVRAKRKNDKKKKKQPAESLSQYESSPGARSFVDALARDSDPAGFGATTDTYTWTQSEVGSRGRLNRVMLTLELWRCFENILSE